MGAPLSVMLWHKSAGLFWLPDVTRASQFLHLQRPPRTIGRIGWQDTHTPTDLEIQQEESNKHIFKDCRDLTVYLNLGEDYIWPAYDFI